MVKVELGQLWRDKDKGLRLAKVVGFHPSTNSWAMEWIEHPNPHEIGREWPVRTSTGFLHNEYKLEGSVTEFKAGDVVRFVNDDEDYTVLAAHGNHVWLNTALAPSTVSVTSVHHKPTFFEVGKTYGSRGCTYAVRDVYDFAGHKYASAEWVFQGKVTRDGGMVMLEERDWPMEEQ